MGRRQVGRTARAEQDLIDLWNALAEFSLPAAERLLDRVAQAERRLADYPESGSARPDFGEAIRVVILDRFLVFYELSDETIKIVRVLDGRRNIGAQEMADA